MFEKLTELKEKTHKNQEEIKDYFVSITDYARHKDILGTYYKGYKFNIVNDKDKIIKIEVRSNDNIVENGKLWIYVPGIYDAILKEMDKKHAK